MPALSAKIGCAADTRASNPPTWLSQAICHRARASRERRRERASPAACTSAGEPTAHRRTRAARRRRTRRACRRSPDRRDIAGRVVHGALTVSVAASTLRRFTMATSHTRPRQLQCDGASDATTSPVTSAQRDALLTPSSRSARRELPSRVDAGRHPRRGVGDLGDALQRGRVGRAPLVEVQLVVAAAVEEDGALRARARRWGAERDVARSSLVGIA